MRVYATCLKPRAGYTDHTEIEVKARVGDMSGVAEKLRGFGCVFSPPTTQDDAVYVAKTGSLETFLGNDVFLRVRVENGAKAILTAKKPITKSAEQLVKHEHEVVVDSADEARGILELLGLHENVRIKKVRQTAVLGDMHICIDDIEGLGVFIELERMGAESEATRMQQEMNEFLGLLGISPADQVKKGYDILMLEKNQG